ncbi:hypothetical protein CF319_g6815 [Tilletia indica]|nr:hypothetical protein CF319_g6815 [Tilletia indica]
MTAPPSLSKPDNDDPIVDLPALPASSVSRAKQTTARRAATPHHEDTDEEDDCHDPVQDTSTKTSQTQLPSGSALGSDLGTTPLPPLSRSTS